jgi:hypothetical protein
MPPREKREFFERLLPDRGKAAERFSRVCGAGGAAADGVGAELDVDADGALMNGVEG